MLLIEFPRSGWPANVYTGELRFVVEDFEAVDKVGDQLNLSNEDNKNLRTSNLSNLPIAYSCADRDGIGEVAR